MLLVVKKARHACVSHTPCLLWIKNALERCRYYNMCIMRNSVQACECAESLWKQRVTWLIAEEYVKLSGRLNTITINNWLTKADFKVLVSISIFGRLVKGNKQTNKKTTLQSFHYHNLLVRPFLCIINERASLTYSLTDTHATLCCLLLISSTLHGRLLCPHHCFLIFILFCRTADLGSCFGFMGAC